jgi:hypothetical protein
MSIDVSGKTVVFAGEKAVADEIEEALEDFA